jgi:phosphosulfolactate synthase
MDKGLTLVEAEGLLETAGEYVDIVKLGWGTSYVTANLAEKIRLYQSHAVPVMCGGTLLEAAIARGRVDEFRRWTAGYGFTHVEVSDGTIQIARESKLELISALAEEYVVLSEVGSKDAECVYAPYQWVAWIKEELAAGATKVITESREAGNAGIFRGSGEVRSGLVDEIVHEIPLDSLLFEAPQKEQQAWFIRHLGAEVNLGNIPPDEVIPLETLRLGLRSDTMADLLLRDLPTHSAP